MTIGASRLQLAAAASTYLKPSEILDLLRGGGIEALWGRVGALAAEQLDAATEMAERLADRSFAVVYWGDSEYPGQLADLRPTPPILFWAGSFELIQRPGVGICGSRDATETGLRAARTCGAAIASAGLVVISGNARGVDAEADSGARETGGPTVRVLPEGPLNYKPRADEVRTVAPTLVISQFAPRMPWNVGAAMARNGVIAALSDALVVIEAGSTGGTLNAGLQGLALRRPVLALEFDSSETPPGNRILHQRGAVAVSRPSELTSALDEIGRLGPPQRKLPLGV